jgi:hypothetical protein
MEVLIFLSAKTFSLVAANGNVIATAELTADGRKISATKSFQLKENRFVMVEWNAIITGYIEYSKY